MDVEEAGRRLSGVQITEASLKERQNNEGETTELSEEDQVRFNKYLHRAKLLVEEGNIEQALHYNKKALKICHKEKLARKIKKMEDYLKTNAEESSEEDNNGMIEVGQRFYLFKELYEKLYAHQKEGILWLWSLYKKRKGGILGDDMGLGKTIQVIGFLSGMFDMGKIKSVLIVLPVAVMVNWENEFNKWAPGLKVEAYHGNSKREKERALAKVQRRGGICLTTYGLVVTSWEQLGQKDGVEFTWDYMILDEGHKIKNPTKTSKGVHAIPAKNRIILTGTPVQNNLKELWALFDFVHQGSLLGTQRTFKMEYENPITRAREKDATMGEKRLGMEMAESLKRIIAPFFLRRTKAEVKNSENKENVDPDAEVSAKMPTMTRKNDLIVWLFMSETQLKIYKDFLELDSVKELLMTKKSPLVALNVLKKICDHPRLLSMKACAQLGVDGDEGLDDELLETAEAELSAATRIQHVADEVLIRESGKMVFLIKLLDQLKVEGHRCLVFSQSRKILDIMQKVLTNKGHKVQRLDGTISQVYEREERINKFQTDKSYSVFLLTTQVGGVGLTLTAADRVVIFDPSWNPATDAQAVDRAFRIGQDKNVVIYRLITCGTVEEKIYRRQIFKDSITRQTTGNAKNPYRYFSKYELRELFTLDDPHSSTTQQQLEQMHSGHRLTDPSLDAHIAFLYSLNMFGLSDHDLMFSHGASAGDDQDVEDDSAGQENDYIQHRVNKAQQLIQMESSQPNSLEERLGTSQKSESGYQSNRNQFDNWNIPKPQDEIPGSRNTLPEVNSYGNEIDLTSPQKQIAMTTDDDDDAIAVSSDEDDVKPDIKFEKPEVIVKNVKEEPNLMKSPHVKTENKEKHLLDNDVVMDSPKPLQTKLKEENDLNMSIDDHHQNKHEKSGNMDMNISADESSSHNILSPSVKKTPKMSHITKTPIKNNDRIIAEQLLISPDGSQPLIMTEPKQSVGESAIRRNLDSRQNYASKLNATMLSNLTDTPEDLESTHNSKSSVSSAGSDTPKRVLKTLIEDSPSAELNEPKSKRLVITDSPEKSGSDEDDKNLNRSIKMDASMLADSVLEESLAMEENGEKALSFNMDKREKKHLEKSMHDLDLDADNALPDLDSNTKSSAKSFIQNDDDDLLPDLDVANKRKRSIVDSDPLPDLDSPVITKSVNKSKSFKKHVIESSDENSDLENHGDEDIDDEDIDHAESEHIVVNADDSSEDEFSDKQNDESDAEMDHSVNDEDKELNGSIDEEVEDNKEMEEEHYSEEEVEEEEEEYSEEESDSENTDDEDGAQDFESLSHEVQTKYNSLVDTGREYCRKKDYELAQVCVLQALELFPDPQLQDTAQQIHRKILKQQALREQGMA